MTYIEEILSKKFIHFGTKVSIENLRAEIHVSEQITNLIVAYNLMVDVYKENPELAHSMFDLVSHKLYDAVKNGQSVAKSNI